MPDWYQFCLNEIERSGRSLTDSEKGMIQTTKDRISMRITMTKPQESFLLSIHKRVTEPIRIWKGRK